MVGACVPPAPSEHLSLEQFRRTARLLEVAATREDRLALLGQLGGAQLAFGHFREAELTLSEAVALAGELADARAQVGALVRLAAVRRQLNRPEPALDCLRLALAVAETAGGKLADLHALTSHQLGCALAELGERAEAAEHLTKALALRRTAGSRVDALATEKALDALRVARAQSSAEPDRADDLLP